MTKELLNDVVLFVPKNTHEIDKQCLKANSDGKVVTMKYQV